MSNDELLERACCVSASQGAQTLAARHIVMSSVHVLYIVYEYASGFAENAERSFCLRITCGSAAAGARVAQNCCRRRRTEYSVQNTLYSVQLAEMTLSTW